MTPGRATVFVAGAVYHTLVGVDGYGLRVKGLAGRLRMNAGSASRVLARGAVREREEIDFHEQLLALEEHLAKLEARCRGLRR